MSRDKFSANLTIVLPTIGTDVLAVALRSILRQTVAPAVVIVDDRRDVVEPLSGAWPLLNEVPNLQIVTTGGVGLAAARNIGLDQVGDGWVALLDDDDSWCPHHCERLLQTAELTGSNFVWSGSRVVTWGAGAKVSPVGFGWANALDYIYSTNLIPPSSVMFRCEDGTRFDPHVSELEDWDFWLTLLDSNSMSLGFTGVITMGYGRNIVSKASMTMSATFKPERQGNMLEFWDLICAKHPIPEGVKTIRGQVREARLGHEIGASATNPLKFDYYERTLERLVGFPVSNPCCTFDLSSDFEHVEGGAR